MHFLPGGTLVQDNEETPFGWRVRGWSEPSGGEISLRSRVDAVDEEDRCVHMTIRAQTPDDQQAAGYGLGSTTLATTQRCLPILRSRTNPSCSYVDRAPWKRKPAGTAPASSG
jgi:hypothetical protein